MRDCSDQPSSDLVSGSTSHSNFALPLLQVSTPNMLASLHSTVFLHTFLPHHTTVHLHLLAPFGVYPTPISMFSILHLPSILLATLYPTPLHSTPLFSTPPHSTPLHSYSTPLHAPVHSILSKSNVHPLVQRNIQSTPLLNVLYTFQSTGRLRLHLHSTGKHPLHMLHSTARSLLVHISTHCPLARSTPVHYSRSNSSPCPVQIQSTPGFTPLASAGSESRFS